MSTVPSFSPNDLPEKYRQRFERLDPESALYSTRSIVYSCEDQAKQVRSKQAKKEQQRAHVLCGVQAGALDVQNCRRTLDLVGPARPPALG